jgi:hypothetical protein
MINPALTTFLASFTEEREWAQVLVRKTMPGYELRQVADRATAAEQLRPMTVVGLRKLSLFTATGQFRPLKSAPDLPGGWRLVCREEAELWRALQNLYPGSIPDWHAVRSGTPAITNYRDFTNRQTGMYRITQLHSDEQAARVIAACCPPQFCLKQRLWTVRGIDSDQPQAKSAIPCLEPCAVLLEFSRKSARIEQEAGIAVSLSSSDLDSFLRAVQAAIELPRADARAGDFGDPLNPRRLQLLLEKFQNTVKPASSIQP